MLDDTTPDKPYARKMELVFHHWSGKHRRVVRGINLQTLLWSDAEIHLPIDCRVYDKPHDPLQGQTKNAPMPNRSPAAVGMASAARSRG